MSAYQDLLKLVKKYHNMEKALSDPDGLNDYDNMEKALSGSDTVPEGFKEDMKQYASLMENLEKSNSPTENFEDILNVLLAAPCTWGGDVFPDTHTVLDRFPRTKDYTWKDTKRKWSFQFRLYCSNQEEMTMARSIVEKYVAMEKELEKLDEKPKNWGSNFDEESYYLLHGPYGPLFMHSKFWELIVEAPCTWKANEEKPKWKTKEEWKKEWSTARQELREVKLDVKLEKQ